MKTKSLLLSLSAVVVAIGFSVASAQTSGSSVAQQKSKAKTPKSSSAVLKPEPSSTKEVTLNGYIWKLSDLQPLRASNTSSVPLIQHPATQTPAQSEPIVPKSDAHPPAAQ
jgi:hypothetical protein